MRRMTTLSVVTAAGAAFALLVAGVGPASAHVTAAEAPSAARPAATPLTTTADVLSYLRGIEGNHIVSGQHNAEPNTTPAQYTNQVHAITGVYPGLWGGDFLYESDSIAARQTMINEAKAEWAAGSLVTLMWHECPPTMSEPCSWSDVESKLSSTQWTQLVTNGTALNNAWKAELDTIVPYLQQLKDANIPVLWRPLHEINDAWSWWGGTADSAKLFQITHDYLAGTKGLTNLIWVWSVKDDSTSTLSTYYPGNQYVDVVGLDPWNSSWPSTQWYQAIQSLAGSKPMALAEVGTLPTPAQLSSQPDWTYFNDWADYINTNNTNATVKATYYDAQVLHRGDINLAGSGGSGTGGTGASGPITGYGGLCVDDRASSTADLNPVQVYTCNGGTAQNWTVASNGSLQVFGKCMDVDSGATADGSAVDLYTCNGTGAQVWQAQANGSLLNPQSGKCLDDTGWSTTAGTQLQIWDCGCNANQVWKLP
jgi:mannan endo-1,4-beta-mannosidase